MAPLELLNTITCRGGTVRADGGLLRVTPPPEGLSETDLAALKVCKAELLELVKAAAHEVGARVAVDDAQDAEKCRDSEREGTPAAAPDPEDSDARAVSVYAPALGCWLLCVQTAEDVPEDHTGPFYTRAELALMRGLHPDELRDVHGMKETFGGTYDGRADNPRPPAWKPGDRVRGYAGAWKAGTVQSILPDDEWTAPGSAGLVMVQLDDTPHLTAFRPARLWPLRREGPPPLPTLIGEAQALALGI